MICITSISVTPKSMTLNVGDYGSPSVTISPSNATCKDLRWSSSCKDVASVSSTTGEIYARGGGSAVITARATDGSGKSDSLTVTVNESIYVSSITFSKSSLTLSKGCCESNSVTVCPICYRYIGRLFVEEYKL